MRSLMPRTPHHLSASISRRHFKWMLKLPSDNPPPPPPPPPQPPTTTKKKSKTTNAAARFRSALLAALRPSASGGSKLFGTLFGHRRGHVHLAFQLDPKSPPLILIELATPTNALVREMASGLVRIALECERRDKDKKLLEESLWSTYCNGKKCGYAVRKDCGPVEWTVLRAVEPVSMGAGVLPVTLTAAAKGKDVISNNVDQADEVMYMRARFERVVGSRDSEAFYMMNPDGNGGPELSVYLLRL